MKRTLLISLFILTSCAPTLTVAAPTVAASTMTDVPRATHPIPTATATDTSVPPSPTVTPVPCDPLAADFCTTEGHFIFQRPILPPGDDSVERTYSFASTAGGTRDPHHGVEFTNGTGTPVHAAADGQVIFAGSDDEAVYSPWTNFYGNVIVIRHADEFFTLYAHLSVIDVKVGQKVTAGQKIGEVGRTGGAIGSHLHFEVRRGDVENYFSALNPELWLIPKADEGVLAISVVNALGIYQHAELTIQSDGRSYYIKTYEAVFLAMDENAALGGLTPGRYRITFYFGGQIYERWVDVQSGKLTQVVFVVK
jgi:hypothetical protein